jgi:hypothetical protein
VAVLKTRAAIFFISLSNPILLDKQPAPYYPHLAKRVPSSIGPDISHSLHLERGKMTPTSRILLFAASVLGAIIAIPSTAHAQPGYGGRITCSSDDGRRNWCDIGPSRDVRLVRQISGSACVQGQTWGVDGRGLWVDRGCRADFSFRQGGGGGGGQQQTVNCSSNDGRRNWCDIGRARDAQLVRQISGSPCIQGRTWGVDGRGLWVDNGCRADFAVGRGGGGGFRPPPGPPAPIMITCSSNDGRRNWCDVGGRRDIRLNRQISGSACVQGQTWGTDNRGIWVDRGCRAEFRVR